MAEGIPDPVTGGGLIDPEFLLRAYRVGIFPMGLEGGEIGWFSPDPRGVIPLDDRFHVPHGLARLLRKERFETRVNSAFDDVILGCADRPETWIDATVTRTYQALHRLGFAHSVEAWADGELAGGLYGVSIGGAFFGESMFSRASGASQVALVTLVRHLQHRGFVLLDTQWTTPHLRRFGAVELPKRDYLERLRTAVTMDCSF